MTSTIEELREQYGPDGLQAIYFRYMDPDTPIKRVLEEFNIPLSPCNLLRLIPDIVRKDVPCRHCGAAMHQRPRKKTQALDNPFDCPECGHREHDATTIEPSTTWGRPFECECPFCREERAHAEARAREAKQRRVSEWIANQEAATTPLPYEQLTTRQKILLVARLAAYLSNKPYLDAQQDHNAPTLLMPTEEASLQLDRELYEAQVLRIAPECPADAFTEDLASFHVGAARWVCSVDLGSGNRCSQYDLFDRLGSDLMSADASIADTCQALLEEIAVEVTMQSLESYARKACVNFSAHAKAREVLRTLARDHSLEELRYYAYKAVRNAVDYWRGKTPSPGNTIPKGVAKYAEMARKNQWDIPEWTRYNDEPRGATSIALHTLAFRKKAAHLEVNSPPRKIIAAVWPELEQLAPASSLPLTNAPRCPHCDTTEVSVRFGTLQISVTCLAPECSKTERYHRLAAGDLDT